MLKINDRQKNIAINIAKGLFCLAVGLVCGYFSLYSNLTYDTNDDAASMILLATQNNDFSPLFAKPLSMVLSFLYRLSPLTPWWLYITLATIIGSLVVLLYLLIRKLSLKNFAIILPITIFAYMEMAVAEINFTKTAACAAIAGMVLLLQGIEDYDENIILAIIEVVFGTGIWLFGAMIRDQIAFVTIPFAAIYIIYQAVTRYGIANIKKLLKELVRPAIICGCALVFSVSMLFVSSLFLTEAERESIAYYDARISVQDYADNYPEYHEATAEYQELSISENDYHLIFNDWTTEDPDFFTTELFVLMRENLYSLNGISEIFVILVDYLLSNNGVLALFLLMIFGIYLSVDKKSRILIAIFGAVILAYILYLAAVGRVVDRVVYPAVFYGIILSLFLAKNKSESTGRESLNRAVYLSVLSISLLFFVMIPTFWGNIEDYEYNKFADHSSGRYSINAQNFYIMIAEDKDIAYMLPLMNGFEFLPSEGLYPRYQPRTTMFENLFFLGGWDARTPINYERLDDFDIENPMQSLYLNANVLTGYDVEIDRYLKDHYNENMSISQAKSLTLASGFVYGFFQYCEPIVGDIKEPDGTEAIYIENYSYQTEYPGYTEGPSGGRIYLSGALGKVGVEEYAELYLNAETPDGRRSFRIYVDDFGNFESYAFGLTIEDITESEISIVALTKDGEYINTGVLDEFIESEEE